MNKEGVQVNNEKSVSSNVTGQIYIVTTAVPFI